MDSTVKSVLLLKKDWIALIIVVIGVSVFFTVYFLVKSLDPNSDSSISVLEKNNNYIDTVGDECHQSFDCTVPGEYAALSHCPYQASCYKGKCVVYCPIFEQSATPDPNTDTDLSLCKEDNECNCSGWDTEEKYPCRCLDGRCGSIVVGA